MGKAPDERLRRIWLDAVMLPGQSDPRESCLAELEAYTGLPREEIERRCQASQAELKEIWEQRERADDAAIEAFYREADPYLFNLLWWHALQEGPAVAWNARIVELAREHGAKTALEFGGGIGSLAIALQQAGIETTLADVSRPSLAFARWRAEQRAVPLRIVDLGEKGLGAERYDLVTAVDVLEHVPDPVATLEELAERVAPEGLFCFDLIAGGFDPDEPFHLMRSKYPIRARWRSLGFRQLEKFGKYLMLSKVERPALANRAIRAWDVSRWRLYYLLQGKWPSAR